MYFTRIFFHKNVYQSCSFKTTPHLSFPHSLARADSVCARHSVAPPHSLRVRQVSVDGQGRRGCCQDDFIQLVAAAGSQGAAWGDCQLAREMFPQLVLFLLLIPQRCTAILLASDTHFTTHFSQRNHRFASFPCIINRSCPCRVCPLSFCSLGWPTTRTIVARMATRRPPMPHSV
jgi:hypothetical protein